MEEKENEAAQAEAPKDEAKIQVGGQLGGGASYTVASAHWDDGVF